jgi:LytS/YehU family sensor histidine kinase
MVEDEARTLRLIDGIEQLLRAATSEAAASWELSQEADITRRFVELLEARFGERVRVSWALPPELALARVPRFGLQLLVENAVKHNQQQRGTLAIRIEGTRRASRLVLSVSDNGRGFDGDPSTQRGGLGRLAEILRRVHGDQASLTCDVRGDVGARIEMVVPMMDARASAHGAQGAA